MAQYEKLEDKRIKLTVTIPADEFEEAIGQAYIKERGRFAVPGFRKGKATRKVIEKAYGDGVFYEGAFDIAYFPAYVKAVQEEKLQPVGAPDIDIVSISAADGVVFTATFPVMPVVTVKSEDYKGIELVKQEYTVSDDQVEAALNRELEKNARFVAVERPVEQGDKIVLDYAGTVNGVAFEGGTAENQVLDIGSGMFVPGFEDQLVGVGVGEEKDVVVTFPENYGHKDLAGKEAVFHCKVHEVKVKELPAADDDFAKDVSEFDTIDEFKADLRRQLEEDAKNRARNAMENNAVAAVIKNVEIDVPQAMVDTRVDDMIRELQQQMSYSGMTLDQYLQLTGTNMETLRKNYEAPALFRVKGDLVLKAIADAEGITASDEEVEQEFENYAKSVGRDVAEVKEMLKDVNLDDVRFDIAMRKAIDVIVDNAKLVDKPAPQDTPVEGEAQGEPAETPAE